MFHTNNYSTWNKKKKYKKKYKKYSAVLNQTNNFKKFKFTFFLKKYKNTKNTLFFKNYTKKNALNTRQFFFVKPYNSFILSSLKPNHLFSLKRQKRKNSKFLEKNKKQTLFSKKLMKIAILRNQNLTANHKPTLAMRQMLKNYKRRRGVVNRTTNKPWPTIYPTFTRRVSSIRHKKFTLFFSNNSTSKTTYVQSLDIVFKKTLSFKTIQTLFDSTSFFKKNLFSQNHTNYFNYLLQNCSLVSSLYNTYNFDYFYTNKIQHKLLNYMPIGVVSQTATLHSDLKSPFDRLATSPSSIPNQTNHLLSTHNLTLFHNFLVEKSFLRKNTLNSPYAMFVLTKAPSYRMNIHTNTPISTSPYYGNIYRTSTFNISKPFKFDSPFYKNLFFKSKVFNTRVLLIKGHKVPSIKNYLKNNLRTLKTQFENYGNMKLKNIIYSKNLIKTQKPKKLSKRFLFKVNLKLIRIKIRTNRKDKNTKTLKKKKMFKERYKFVKSNRNFHFKQKKLKFRQFKAVLKKTLRYLRWESKRNNYYFTKFLKINKKRKIKIKNSIRLYNLNNKTIKYKNYYSSSKQLWKNKNITTNYTIKKSYLNHINLTNTLLSRNFQLKLLSNIYYMWILLTNPFFLKTLLFHNNQPFVSDFMWTNLTNNHVLNPLFAKNKLRSTNIAPAACFNKIFTKKVLNSFANKFFRDDIIPLYQNTLIRFIEFCTGKKALFQFYPFVNQHIDKSYIVRYKWWIPRMNFYERQLGHRFFLEESLHIIHISFILRDPKIIASWLKAMILRISFWKTRSIFRFLKYLFHNYFIHVFSDIKIKGLKIKLKGKISAAGNSRKRTILYRIGKTSHSEVNLRVVKDFSLINTFTGVMGFQVYLFY